jgi:arginyl-tRNA synthetase
MTDPLARLVPLFHASIVEAFGPEHGALDPMLRPSRFADFQANAALGLAKTLRRPPREVAQAMLDKLPRGDVIERAEVAGPGFVNLWLQPSYLSRELAHAATVDLGLEPVASSDTVVIDYSSPNIAKEMHVGHLRSSIIGDALARVLEGVGHRVIRQNHIGDWGTPFGMLMEHLLDVGLGEDDHSVTDLNAFYQGARSKFEGDGAFAERSRRRVVLLQGGDPETLALWQRFVAVSKRHIDSVYAVLGVTLKDEHIRGESFYNPMLADTVGELERLGLAVESDGALCAFPSGFVGRDDRPLPLIVRKKDGGYGYATTDLAAIRYRAQTLGAARVVYVVGAEQSQHLAMVFETARVAGWLAQGSRAEHVAFGAVLGTDKKKFKTRAGQSVRLIDLLDEAVRRAQAIVAEKNPALSSKEQEGIARAVGIGAVKYADLSSDRVKDYVFDWDRMLSFDGNTAPYLQYAHARIRSIFRKGGSAIFSPEAIRVAAEQERRLSLALLSFPSVVAEVADTLCPHKLCGYLYELATTFSGFYEACPVLKAPSDEDRASRLALCDLTARILARGLELLGIAAPERM